MKNCAKLMVLGLVLGGCYNDDDRDPAEGTSGMATDGVAETGTGMMFTTGPSTSAPTTTIGTTADPSTTEPGTTTGDPMETSSGPIEEESSSGGSDSTGAPIELSCDAYCDLYLDACQDFSEYANPQHCLDHCSQWPEGDPLDTGHDSLGCRTYHATVASGTDANLHCPHSGPSGEATCVSQEAPTCELYCTRYFNNCEGDLNLWESMDSCMGQCGLWYKGDVDDISGHTAGCRSYYANLAAGDAEMHCPNAGPGGGEACVLPAAG